MAIQDTEGKQPAAARIVLHGPNKIGKSDWCSEIPDARHIDAEKGTLHLAIPWRTTIDSWEDLLEVISQEEKGGEAKALVLDTLDAIQHMLHTWLMKKSNVASVEDIGGGWKKGWIAAAEQFRSMWMRLMRLNHTKGVTIIGVCHSELVNVANPLDPNFKKYTLALHEMIRGFVLDQVDIIAFANYETTVGLTANKAKRTMMTGARVLHLAQNAAFDAGSRYPMPDSIPLSWPEFRAAWERGRIYPADWYRERIEEVLTQLNDDEFSAHVRGTMKTLPEVSLPKALSRLNARLWTARQEGRVEAPGTDPTAAAGAPAPANGATPPATTKPPGNRPKKSADQAAGGAQ